MGDIRLTIVEIMRCLMRLHLTCVFVRFADCDTSLFSRVLTVVYPSFTTVYLVMISCVLYAIELVFILYAIELVFILLFLCNQGRERVDDTKQANSQLQQN